jgi:hypothetical protein
MIHASHGPSLSYNITVKRQVLRCYDRQNVIALFSLASVVEWSITTDCKSVALRASLVQIQPDAHQSKNTEILFRVFTLTILTMKSGFEPRAATREERV